MTICCIFDYSCTTSVCAEAKEQSIEELDGYHEIPGAGEDRLRRIVNHLTYRIATGKWQEGYKLPSVRVAEKRWGVNRRTILAAYRRLADAGLVRGADRSGYYVTAGGPRERVLRHRVELERAFDRFVDEITDRTGLSLLGAFRYFANLAEIRAREAPECAFVECTTSQAMGHAREVEHRLDVPCEALTIDQLDGRPDRVPPAVRCLLVSAFHARALGRLRGRDDLTVLTVPVELSPEIASSHEDATDVVVVEYVDREAENIAGDVRKFLPDARVTWKVGEDVNAIVASLLARGERGTSPLVLLSPRAWDAARGRYESHPFVAEARFRIVEHAWPRIADGLGLPLGVHTSRA